MFGTTTRTNILLSLALIEESHASELARLTETSVSNVQKTLDSLEQVGAVSGAISGRERRVRLNPRFYARDELRALLDKMAIQNAELVAKVTELRRRPRRAGKAL
jgi:DNA-binding MarR family transcriptional regulator